MLCVEAIACHSCYSVSYWYCGDKLDLNQSESKETFAADLNAFGVQGTSFNFTGFENWKTNATWFFQWQVLTRRVLFCLGFRVYFYWIKTCWYVLCCDGRFLCSGNLLFYISTSLFYWVLNHFIGLYCFLYHDPYRVTLQYVQEDIILNRERPLEIMVKYTVCR